MVERRRVLARAANPRERLRRAGGHAKDLRLCDRELLVVDGTSCPKLGQPLELIDDSTGYAIELRIGDEPVELSERSLVVRQMAAVDRDAIRQLENITI